MLLPNDYFRYLLRFSKIALILQIGDLCYFCELVSMNWPTHIKYRINDIVKILFTVLQ